MTNEKPELKILGEGKYQCPFCDCRFERNWDRKRKISEAEWLRRLDNDFRQHLAQNTRS